MPLLDLDSRARVVIRPGCKRFAMKQRALGATLACFTSFERPPAPLPQPKVVRTTTTRPPFSISAKTPIVSAPRPLLSGLGQPSSKLGKIAVMEGRIEKRVTPPRRASSASSTSSNHSVYSDELDKCPCTLPGRSECQRCEILRLADRFCVVVSAQCEKWDSPPSTP
ncbi:hypothetical protein FA15DRAFT_676271 [Coprinopsis marcescibilis]|uniref:Uncharacterized protein n=1 Tax=Coprinopsis marcescibilis TaxID=230819 RepID=A0A5C3KB03_COPMA|nr:hypothetical protein FA15DRAFT_676271 [Coprinopsis marcescibilis]